jgi:hypothetical protein
LIDKYNASAALLNGLAAAKMHAGQFEEAEGYLQDALTKVQRSICLYFALFIIFEFSGCDRPQRILTRWRI